MSFRVSILPHILRTVRPDFLPFSMLFVIPPFPCIFGAIYVWIYSVAMCFVIQVSPFVHISVMINNPPLAISLVFFPKAFVNSPVIPSLHSHAVALVQWVPLSYVNATLIYFNWSLLHESSVFFFIILLIVKRAQLLSELFDHLVGLSGDWVPL